MKPLEIQDLIKFVAKSGVSEVEIENKDFKITIKTPPHKKGKFLVEAQAEAQGKVVVSAPVAAPVHAAPVHAAPVQVAPAAPVASEKPAASNDTDNSNYVSVKSPMIGTFYRKPSPDKANFVNVGDDVAEDSVVCMIEAMKLFNEIESEITGKIVKILVDDGSPVEYDQPLFLVDPS